MPFLRCSFQLAGVLALTASGAATFASLVAGQSTPDQPAIEARHKPVLTADGLRFKDANGSGRLDPYEDWRLPVEARVRDLVSRMTLEEKAGLMLIETLNAGCGGALSPAATELIETQKMTRFILRSVVKGQADLCDGSVKPGRGGFAVTPRQMAEFTNAVQALAESQRLGIPVQFKDNARNHYETDPRFGISAGAGAFTEFPKEAGIAAAALGTGDMSPVKALADVMSREWRAVGLRGMYGYMADLATEPRWYRVQETFTENADLAASIMRALVEGLQGGPVSPASAVALTVKHFPGGGPQEMGLDPHYSFGKRQVYPGGRFGDHLKPFTAAIDAGVSAVMPYYGLPVNATYEGVTYGETGFAFSRQIVTDLLRGKLRFAGYVNSDTGIITDRAWGLEGRTVPERVAAAVLGVDSNYGTDLLAPMVDRAKQLAGDAAGGDVGEAPFRVIADHARATAFLVADGVFPDRGGRSYVLRRIMRRAIRHGADVGLAEPFMHEVCRTVVEVFGDVYPELHERAAVIEEVVRGEEESFRRTLDRGLQRLRRAIERHDRAQPSFDPGTAAELYDTFGFPIDLTAVILREHDLSLDEAAAEQQLKERQGGGDVLVKELGAGEAIADVYFQIQHVGGMPVEPYSGQVRVTSPADALENGAQSALCGLGREDALVLNETIATIDPVPAPDSVQREEVGTYRSQLFLGLRSALREVQGVEQSNAEWIEG